MSDDACFEGACTCAAIRYRMTSTPLFVHCCHCAWSNRKTGSAFALNAMIETDRLQLLQGRPDMTDTPSNSGKGQRIARCPRCRVALWSHYAGAGEAVAFVRVGTLDEALAATFTGHPHLHLHQAALGGAVVRDSCRGGVLRPQPPLARHQQLARREALLAATRRPGDARPS
ncbi:GFA family protein [Rhodanobacter lindaniclasticus]